jgi:hypothetical protein
MRQDAHRCIEQQMVSPIATGLAVHSDLGDMVLLERALNRWSARQESTRNPFARRNQRQTPLPVTEEEYKAKRTQANNKRLLEKWGIKTVKNADLAEIRAKEKLAREQAQREKSSADYSARVAALPEHIRAAYSLKHGENRAWQRLKTAEWITTLSTDEQNAILEKRRIAKKSK